MQAKRSTENSSCVGAVSIVKKASTQRRRTSALTHLRSQDLFKVILIFHVGGLLFPGMAVVTQWHPLVVAVRDNTGVKKKDKEETLINTRSRMNSCISDLQSIKHCNDRAAHFFYVV